MPPISSMSSMPPPPPGPALQVMQRALQRARVVAGAVAGHFQLGERGLVRLVQLAEQRFAEEARGGVELERRRQFRLVVQTREPRVVVAPGVAVDHLGAQFGVEPQRDLCRLAPVAQQRLALNAVHALGRGIPVRPMWRRTHEHATGAAVGQRPTDFDRVALLAEARGLDVDHTVQQVGFGGGHGRALWRRRQAARRAGPAGSAACCPRHETLPE